MTRSPLSYPLNRGMDLDAGGAADLQTDVMRFMAIISLCLVAIFALVQSLPAPESGPQSLASHAVIEAAPAAEEAPAAATGETPAPEPANVTPAQAPAPLSPPRREPLPPAVPYREPEAVKARAEPVPRPVPAPPAAAAEPPPTVAPAQDGFTLRFESDLALTRLVARNEVGLYAVRPGKALRMSVNRGAVSFWPASSPGQFHEMQESTVPPDVIAALRRSGTAGVVTWGVTLPARLSRELERYLAQDSGGSLVIGANGDLRLER